MAKRFTDTGKWDKGSFMGLTPKMKLSWLYLCDKCDHAGIWDINLKLMSMQLGEVVSLDDLLVGLGEWVELIGTTKLRLVEFVPFQYGNLNPSNRVHRSILDRVDKLKGASKPLSSPFQGAMELDMELDKEKERGESEGKRDALAACKATWIRTLAHYGQARDRLLPSELLAIGRAAQENGADMVALALYGARYEPPHEGFSPRDHVDITRILSKDREGKPRIQKFVGYGTQARAKEARREEIERARVAAMTQPPPPEESTDPVRVREMLAKAGFGKAPRSA